MHIQERKLASGSRFYLRYWKNGKNCCVSKSAIEKDPSLLGRYPFETRGEAEEFIRKSKTINEFKQHSSGLKYLKDKKEYVDLDKLTSLYYEDIKRWAPESHESIKVFFSKYVLPYFLFIEKESNFLKWHLYFGRFKNWLESDAHKGNDYSKPLDINTDNPLLSYSSKNHCIRSLNNFFKSLRERGMLPPTFYAKCEAFPKHLVNRTARTHKDLVGEEEFEEIRSKLCDSAYDFFTVLYRTGMRFNELYSLSMSDLYFMDDVMTGGIEESIMEGLKKAGYNVFGYVVLTSQVIDKQRITGKNIDVPRKPLKGRKTMSLADGRIVPIVDSEAMNILIERFNDRCDDLHVLRNGENEKNYFLFNESHNQIRADFRANTKKSFHASCRHTFTTRLVGKTRDQILTRVITGHNSLDSFERYVHIYEEYTMGARREKKARKRASIPTVVRCDESDAS